MSSMKLHNPVGPKYIGSISSQILPLVSCTKQVELRQQVPNPRELGAPGADGALPGEATWDRQGWRIFGPGFGYVLAIFVDIFGF